MTSQERISLALSHKEADRVAIHDSPWETSVRRWKNEGLPPETTADEYFDYEFVFVYPDNSLQLPEEVIDENEEYVVIKNSNGAIIKNWKQSTSTPEMIGFTIKNKQIWEDYRSRLAMHDSRLDIDNTRKTIKTAQQAGKFTALVLHVGYDKHSCIVGPETLLPAMLDEPDWPADMFMQDAKLNIAIAEDALHKGIDYDAVFLCDDLGYRNATFFSPLTYRKLLLPAHKMICDFLKAKHKPILLHSCGNVQAFIPMLIEAGFTCLQPLEVKAGMDLIKLKQKFGNAIAFMGGIDVRKMAHPNPDVIEEEIAEKITFAKKGGGYIYHSDHSIPDNVSFQQYDNVIKLVKKYGKY